MSKKSSLSDKEFTDDSQYGLDKKDEGVSEPIFKPELLPFCDHLITYQVNGLDPFIGEYQSSFRPNPTSAEVIDDLVKKNSYLFSKRYLISILKINTVDKFKKPRVDIV